MQHPKIVRGKVLNALVHDYFHITPTEPERILGIEIEAEFDERVTNDVLRYAIPMNGWRAERDGSLRNGLEYVFNQPMTLTSADKALKTFAEKTAAFPFRYSIRTSVHFHINVSTYRLSQIFSILAGYLLVENILVAYNGIDREGNLFCLRSKDAEGLILDLSRELESGRLFNNSASDNTRYSSLNLKALKRFGSLEFRFVKGTTDVNLIWIWALTFIKIIDFFKDKTVDEILNLYTQREPLEILKLVLYDKMYAKIGEVFNIDQVDMMMQENALYLMVLNSALNKATFLDKEQTNEDSVVDPVYRRFQYPHEDLEITPVFRERFNKPEEVVTPKAAIRKQKSKSDTRIIMDEVVERDDNWMRVVQQQNNMRFFNNPPRQMAEIRIPPDEEENINIRIPMPPEPEDEDNEP